VLTKSGRLQSGQLWQRGYAHAHCYGARATGQSITQSKDAFEHDVTVIYQSTKQKKLCPCLELECGARAHHKANNGDNLPNLGIRPQKHWDASGGMKLNLTVATIQARVASAVSKLASYSAVNFCCDRELRGPSGLCHSTRYKSCPNTLSS